MPELLTSDQVRTFQENGVLFPLPALNAEETAAARSAVERLERHYGGPLKAAQVVQPHLHFEWARRLALHPALLDRVACLLGPDILVHSTSIFCKHGRDPAFVSWHQDGYYWALNEPRLISAWVALSASDSANGCMQILPGSHRHGTLTHEERRHADNMLGTGLTLTDAHREESAVAVELPAGSMSLHHVDLVHGSPPNRSDRVRMGFAIRYAWPGLIQKLPHHETILARGEDRFGHFHHVSEPPASDFAEAVRRNDRFAAEIRRIRLGDRSAVGTHS